MSTFDAASPSAVIVEIAHTVAQQIACDAQRNHQHASFPHRAYVILSETGLLGLTVPAKYGGLGSDPITQALCIWEISKGDPAVANTLSMHTTTQRFIAELGTEEQKARLFHELSSERKLTAAATSEPGASFQDKFEMKTVFTPVPGGYRVHGQKHFCSIGRYADRYFVLGKLEGSESANRGSITAIIPRESRGVQKEERWETYDPLGMRATASDSFSLNNVFVPNEDVIGAPGQLLASGLFAMFAICYAAVYGAIGEVVLEWTREYLQKKIYEPARVAKHERAYIGLQMHLEYVKRRLLEACDAFSQDRANAVLPIARAKLVACNFGIDTVLETMQMIGGSSIFGTQFPHGRWLADAAVGQIMPPSQTRCSEVIERINKGGKGVTLLEFL